MGSNYCLSKLIASFFLNKLPNPLLMLGVVMLQHLAAIYPLNSYSNGSITKLFIYCILAQFLLNK